MSLLHKLSFCVFDLETTGGNHQYDKIIEIGLVKIENFEIVDQNDYLINPEIDIPPFIQKLTDITPIDVDGCPIIEEVIDDIIEFMGDSILVAHNTSFDVPFFNSVLRRLGKDELENKSVCTNLMTKYLIPNLLNSNLHYMSKIFNLSHDHAHRALEDALATAELFLKYLEIFVSKGITKINHLYYPRNRYELDSIHYKRTQGNDIVLEKIHSLGAFALVIFKGKEGKILFCLPYTGKKEEQELLAIKVTQGDWYTISFKLYGHLLEMLIHLGDLIKMIDHSRTVFEVMEFLWDKHLPGERCSKIEGRNSDQELLKEIQRTGDFCIVHHLVPEQMLILPIHSLHRKSQLIFRYPGHEKKLLQYIKSKGRLSRKRPSRLQEDPLLRTFFLHYLAKIAKEKKDVFMLKKEMAFVGPRKFRDRLDHFIRKNPPTYHYPRQHI